MTSVLTEALEVLTADIPRDLLSAKALDRLTQLAHALPDILCGGLECRMDRHDERVDLQLCVARGSPDVAALQAFLVTLPVERRAETDAWERLAALIETWADPTSEVNAHVTEIWLEFDCVPDQALTPPSIFIGLRQEPQPARQQLPAVEQALKLLLGAAAWQACAKAVQRCFGACDGGSFVSHIGAMLGRDTDALRLNVKRLETETIGAYLEAVGWPGPLAEAGETARMALSLVDRITLCLDVGSQVAGPFGLECIMATNSAETQRWPPHSALPGIASEKLEALPNWNGRLTPRTSRSGWPRRLIAATLFPDAGYDSEFLRRISHMKLSCVGGRAVSAKSYLWFQHLWMPREQPEAVDLDGFYSDDEIDLWKRIIGPDLHFHFGTFDGTEDLQTGLYRTVRNFFPSIPQGSRVLDLGCGWGGPARLLQSERGCDVTGVTISTSQAAHCRDFGLTVLVGDLEDDTLDLPAGFDVVFSLEMISHICDKTAFLKRIRDLGSRLVLSESCAADGYQGPRNTFAASMELCTVSELAEAVEAAGWRIRSLENRRVQSMRTISLWGENLDRAFGDSPPPGAFAPLRSLVDSARRDRDGWMQSFPLIDLMAE